MNKTYTPTKNNKPVMNWHFVDASDQILGKLATNVAKVLMGKNKAQYSTHINVGDKVVITNAALIKVTGKKATDKVYNWYTGFPGGLKSLTFEKMMEKDPTRAIRIAVSGMLPKNKLRDVRLANLYVYKDTNHPHTSQENAKNTPVKEKKTKVKVEAAKEIKE